MSTDTDLKSWTLPASVQEEYRKQDAAVMDATLRLGSLEAEYLAAKNQLVTDLGNKQKARIEVVQKAAKDAGLDLENEVWTLDVKAMTLQKQPKA